MELAQRDAEVAVNAERGRHTPSPERSGVIQRCWVRYYPTTPDARQQVADIQETHAALVQDAGSDVADSAAVHQAALSSAAHQGFANWYRAAATKAGLETKEGQSYAQLATMQQRFALEATRQLRAIAAEERERRAKDVPTDGRELFGSGKAGR